MESTVAKVCKGTAIILFILGAIGSFILGNSIGKALMFGGFSIFYLSLTFLLGCFLFCILLYAVGTIVEKLTNIDYYTQLSYETQYEKPKDTSPYSGGWVCKKCGKRNHQNSVACSECGEMK